MSVWWKPWRGQGGIDDVFRAEVVDFLGEVGQWELSQKRWTVVRTRVTALHTALRAGNGAAARAAVRELELVGPVRAIEVGANNPTESAPAPVREEIAEIVHTLGGATDSGR